MADSALDRKRADERERLVLGNLPAVRLIAARIHDRLPSHVPLEDLVHAGVLGLLDAVDKFDPRKNVQLKAYARFRIRGAILDSLRQIDWSPRSLRRKARCIEKARHDLAWRLGRIPAAEELAAGLGLGLGVLSTLLSEIRGLSLSSLEQTQESQWESEPVTGFMGGTKEDPFSQCLHEEMRSMMLRALAGLDEKRRRVITLYYLEELTMKEAGAALGVGESRVSQIHSEAIQHLRTQLEKDLRMTIQAPVAGISRKRTRRNIEVGAA